MIVCAYCKKTLTLFQWTFEGCNSSPDTCHHTNAKKEANSVNTHYRHRFWVD